MAIWIMVCPSCGTRNEVPKEAVNQRCGVVYYSGTCIDCKNELEGQQEYWRWLGLEERPPPEDIEVPG